MTLEQLQAEWLEFSVDESAAPWDKGYATATNTRAENLAPFIAREKADRELIRQLYAIVETISHPDTIAESELCKEARARLKESES